MRRWTFFGLAVALVVAGSSGAASASSSWPTKRVAAASPTGLPTFVVRANGAVTAIPAWRFQGDARRLPLAQPITGIAATATGKGYWLVAADGGVFSYGDAHFHGSMVGKHLNAPVVGIASTRHGHGYWLAAADGGVFTFGDARFHGSLAGQQLDQPIVGITPTRSGKGYRLLARDGGVFTFGDATFRGSLGGTGLADVVGLAPTPSGNGYWILRKNGGSYRNCGVEGCTGQVAGPSVASFGDAQKLSPNFYFSSNGKLVADVDFVHDPVFAILANPVRQGYVIFRAIIMHSGVAGIPYGE